jgi:hypothetical protein
MMLSRVAGVLASASLYIYLTHFQVYLPLRDDHPVLAFVLSIMVGILYWQAVDLALALHRRVRNRARQAKRSPTATSADSSRRFRTLGDRWPGFESG